MRIEVLYIEGCPAYQATVVRVSAVLSECGLETDFRSIRVENEDYAKVLGFLGSPTVRIDGVDIEPAARGSLGFGFGCVCMQHRRESSVFRRPLCSAMQFRGDLGSILVNGYVVSRKQSLGRGSRSRSPKRCFLRDGSSEEFVG